MAEPPPTTRPWYPTVTEPVRALLTAMHFRDAFENLCARGVFMTMPSVTLPNPRRSRKNAWRPMSFFVRAFGLAWVLALAVFGIGCCGPTNPIDPDAGDEHCPQLDEPPAIRLSRYS